MSDEVVELGAWCDLVPAERALASPGSVSFAVDEFARLADGRRIVLHSGERGFSVSGPTPRSSSPIGDLTAESIEADVRTTVLPDDDDPAEEHPYEWLRDLLRRQGVLVPTDALRAVPYSVELSERLQRLLAERDAAAG